MALVPYNPTSLAVQQRLTSAPRRARKTQIQQEVLKEVAKVHAAYNVPWMTKAGAMAMHASMLQGATRQPQNRPKNGGGSRTSRPPAAIGTTTQGRPVQLRGTRGSVVTVRHSALFGSVTGSSDFYTHNYRINPGLPDIFPWLAGLATSFDSYRLVSATVRYVPVTGTDTEGAIYVAWDPDPSDSVPTTKSQLMSFALSATGPVWKPFALNIPSQGVKLLRSGEVMNTSVNTYDNGQLTVAVQTAGATLMGDLYLDYTVELITPQMSEDKATLYRPQFFDKVGGTIAKATPLGTLPPVSYGPQCVDAKQFTYPSSGVLRMPLLNVVPYVDPATGYRTYKVLVDVVTQGTGVSNAPTFTCSDAGATVSYSAIVNESTTECSFHGYVSWDRPPLAGTYLTLDWSGTTTVTGVGLRVTQVPHSSAGTVMT